MSTLDEMDLRLLDVRTDHVSEPVLDRLESTGHARYGFCEPCWSDAYGRALEQPEKTQADHYLDILREAEA